MSGAEATVRHGGLEEEQENRVCCEGGYCHTVTGVQTMEEAEDLALLEEFLRVETEPRRLEGK